jgi:hypothetical protein
MSKGTPKSLLGLVVVAVPLVSCRIPDAIVEDMAPPSLPFESIAFYNSLVHGPKPEFDEQSAVGKPPPAAESGTGHSR